MEIIKYWSALFSLGLTPVAIVLGILVVWTFSSTAIQSIRLRLGNLNHTDWLIIGIIVAFIGNVFDNIYWGLAWGFQTYGSPLGDLLFEYGVLSNVPFRQLANIIAAAFHIIAAIEFLKKNDCLKRLWRISLISSTIAGLFVIWLVV